MTKDPFVSPDSRLLLVTGASGAGRSTAIKALEDFGFEAIDNLPLSLLERVVDNPGASPPLAVGIDVRNRDFSADGVVELLDRLAVSDVQAELLFLDCRHEVLIQRYSETRRRHPLAPSETPDIGIARETELLIPVRARADHLIDTSAMTPHDLRNDIARLFAMDGAARLAVSVESFSYKRGLPRGVDMVFDVRFLANPHWERELRALDGRDPKVSNYVIQDEKFADFLERVTGLLKSLLPAFMEEGKTYVSVAVGCTGGQHRSVAVAEVLAKELAQDGWQVSTRHRELERRNKGAQG